MDQNRIVIDKIQTLKKQIRENAGYKKGSKKELETIECESSLLLTYLLVERINFEAREEEVEYAKIFDEWLKARELSIHQELKFNILNWVLNFLSKTNKKGKILTSEDFQILQQRVKKYGVNVLGYRNSIELKSAIFEQISLSAIRCMETHREVDALREKLNDIKNHNFSL